MNRVSITRTKFTNLANGKETFGYRMYDDHGCSYANTFTDENGASTLPEDDLDLLAEIVGCPINDETSAMLAAVEENGVEIDGEWYDWLQIQDLFK